MGKGGKSAKIRRSERQRKSKARQARRMEGSPTMADRKKKSKSKFVSLKQIKEMSPEAREFLQENGFDEGYFDRRRGDFVAKRGDNVIRGGKITPYDWARV
jgi:hypothetical protein